MVAKEYWMMMRPAEASEPTLTTARTQSWIPAVVGSETKMRMKLEEVEPKTKIQS